MPNRQERTADLPIITCAGPAAKRGQAHGEALRGKIGEGIGRWLESIGATHGIDPDAYLAEFIEGTNYLPAIRRWTPELLDEVAGTARGSQQPWERVYAYNLLDEEWTWARARLHPAPGCTAAGLVPGDGSPILAQTMDIPSIHDGTQAVLRVEPEEGPAALAFTYAGMIGLTGCNEHGLALVVNNLDVLSSSPSGLPVGFVIRGILARQTLADAVAFAIDVPHATGQHYGIGGPEGLASVEGWGTGVAVDELSGHRLRHTNHPLLSAEAASDAELRYQRSRTRERLAHVERELDGAVDVRAIQELLSDRTVPVSLGNERAFMTFGAVVYECRVPARMWLAPGPPHETPFAEIALGSVGASIATAAV